MPTEAIENRGLSRVELAIHRVALNVDSLILNGVQFGLLVPLAPGFLQERADALLSDTDTLGAELAKSGLEESHSSAAILRQLRAHIADLIEVLTRLKSFRSLDTSDLSSAAAQIERARNRCVRLIEDLEQSIHAPRPFYQTRANDSSKAMDQFLSGLANLLEAERKKSRGGAP